MNLFSRARRFAALAALILVVGIAPAHAQAIGSMGYFRSATSAATSPPYLVVPGDSAGVAAFAGDRYDHVLVAAGLNANPLTANHQVGFYSALQANNNTDGVTGFVAGYETAIGLAASGTPYTVGKMAAFAVGGFSPLGANAAVTRTWNLSAVDQTAGTNNAVLAMWDSTFVGNYFIYYEGTRQTRLSGGDLLGPSEIYRPVDNSFLRLAGGNPGGGGANILMFGSTHASNANKGQLNASAGWAVAGQMTMTTGTTSIAPIIIPAGTNLTSPVAGALESDGVAFYNTVDTTNGRRQDDGWNYFRLTGSGTGITTIADFFGTNDGIPLVANGVYEVEWYCYFSQATAGTATWTIVTATTALATLTGEYIGSPIGGIGAVGTPQTAAINTTASSSTAFPVTGTEATAATHFFKIRAMLTAGNGASNMRLRLTMGAGTATPLINSYFRVRRLSATNVGTFVA